MGPLLKSMSFWNIIKIVDFIHVVKQIFKSIKTVMCKSNYKVTSKSEYG